MLLVRSCHRSAINIERHWSGVQFVVAMHASEANTAAKATDINVAKNK